MAISDTITSMYENVGNVYDVLELAGADLTNVDKNIENLKQSWEERLLYFLANGTDTLWNNWLPKVTGSGETITLNNTIEAKMDFVYKGNTYQYSTTGKNIFNSIYYKNQEIYTETISIESGNLYCTKLYLKPNTTYTISEALNNWRLDGGWIFVVADTNNQIIRFLQNRTQDYQTTPTTFTTNSDGYVYIGHRYGFTNGGANRILAFLNTVNIQIEEGNTATSFEEYTGGASPNPDYPQDIQVVSGDNTIKVEGKNLLNKELIENGKATNDYGTPGAIPVVGTTLKRATLTPYNAIEAKPNTKYTFNMTSTTWRFAIAQMDTDKISLGDTGWQTTTPYTITTSANCRYIGFNFSKTDNTNISDEEFNSFINANLMMFEGESVIPYTPYTSQTYPISLENIELCKIGDYQDKIYKDNGKWYLNKQIGKVVLDGSENWQNQFGESLFGTNLTDKKINANSLSYCNYFNFHNIQSGLNTNLLNGEYTIQIGTTDTFYCKNTNYSNTTDFKTWLSTHNTIVYYVLATPTTTEITDTTLISQLEAIKKSYNSQTNISQTNNDMPFELDVVALGELS